MKKTKIEELLELENATIIYKYLSNKINKDEALKLVNKITKKLTKVEEL
jgi:hypothetical protein